MAKPDDIAYEALKKGSASKSDSLFSGGWKSKMPLSPSGKLEWSAAEIGSFKEGIYEMASNRRSETWDDPEKMKTMMSIMDSGTYATGPSGEGRRSIWEKNEGGEDVMKWNIKDTGDPSGRKDISIPRGQLKKVMENQMKYYEDPELNEAYRGKPGWDFMKHRASGSTEDYDLGTYTPTQFK